ncbi:MAG: biotin transporter BioY [Nocardioidaceae bacterium]
MSLTGSAPRSLVLADLWEGGRVRSAVLVLAGAVFTGLAAQVSIPLPNTPVPLTLQTFAVLLTGTALGPTLGALSMILYVGAGVAGVPWFAEQSSGYSMASFGYLIGFIAAAYVCGALARRAVDRKVLGAVASMVLGNVIIYAFGVPVLMSAVSVDFRTALTLGVTPFLLGDVLKIIVAGGLLPSTWKLVGPRD